MPVPTQCHRRLRPPLALWWWLCWLLCLSGCSGLASLEARPSSEALSQTEARSTALGRAITPQAELHPGQSGIYPLADAQDAFAARVLLTGAAERTLDVQYYIWRKDLTGTMLFKALYSAAERGVRVRLLLDDNNTAGLDPLLAALHQHPNIEIRLFNPFVVRKARFWGFITDFNRANRRMHNKSFTADNQATIIGGRNIGDEYFAAGSGMLFADLDVLAVGPVVKDVSRNFDHYWESPSSYPADLILPPPDRDALSQLTSLEVNGQFNGAGKAYLDALRDSHFVTELLIGTLDLEWAPTRMVSDDPAKGLGEAEPEEMIGYKLLEIIGEPLTEVELVSPYFVPTAAGVKAFTALSNSGVRVRILTNSLAATDVAPVHAGYAKWRKPLLKEGVILYETRRLNTDMETSKKAGPFGSSGTSLHAKTFSIDRSRVFIGSLNFDPRSMNYNTELGFIIDSPTLAARIDDAFENDIPSTAYEVRLDDRGRLYWLERRGDEEIRHTIEPDTRWWQRLTVWLLSLLPIEGYL